MKTQSGLTGRRTAASSMPLMGFPPQRKADKSTSFQQAKDGVQRSLSLSQLLSAKADSLRVKGTEAQRHRVFKTHYFFFVPACACPHADRCNAQAGTKKK